MRCSSPLLCVGVWQKQENNGIARKVQFAPSCGRGLGRCINAEAGRTFFPGRSIPNCFAAPSGSPEVWYLISQNLMAIIIVVVAQRFKMVPQLCPP